MVEALLLALIVRAAVSLITLALGVLHLGSHGNSAPVGGPLEGTTSQGRAIVVRVGRHGAKALDMTFSAPCGNGRDWYPRWWPAEGAPVHFHNRGQDFAVREKDAHVEAWMTGRTSEDRHSAAGVARITADFDGRVCDSGIVRWSVRRR